MAMLSIPSYKSDDPNYRYKMPRLIAKVEGRGNGIRTNIVNMGDIARALKRPPDYPTKFCGHELGAQSKFDPAEGKAIVNGMHEQRDLQVLIDKFIDKFVLCENCKLPEIDLTLKKNRVGYSCNACGNQGQVDNRHKLATFILKNPPDGGDSTLGAKKKKSREERQRNRALKATGKTRENGDGIPDGDDVEEDNVDEEDEAERKARRAAKKAAKKEKEKSATKTAGGKTKEKSLSQHPGGDESDDTVKENGATMVSRGQPSSTTGSLPDEEENNSVNGSANPSDGKRKSTKKGKKQATHSNTPASTPDQDELHYQSPEVRDVVQRLLVFCYPEHEEYFQSPNQDDEGHSNAMEPPTQLFTLTAQATPSNFFNQLRLLQVSQDFDHRVKLYVALEVLFHKFAGGLTITGLAKKIAYIQNVAHGMVPSDVLGAFEDFVYCESPFLDGSQFRQYPYVLQKLYNADIVDEDGILRYYTSKRVAKTVDNRGAYESAVKAAKPFLEWLQQSDGESEKEEEEDCSPTAAPSSATQQAMRPAQQREAAHVTATETTDSSDKTSVDANEHVSGDAVKKTDGVNSKLLLSSQAEENNNDEDDDLDIDGI